MPLSITTGNLFESDAECLINTVNCEGFMGKGIAYQFKQLFPDNNKDYIKACKNNELAIGKLHYYKEKNKIIINFPTKNKWREKSKIEYIESGLEELKKLLAILNVKSVALPPLGCGNGGLNWDDVRSLIFSSLVSLSRDIDFIIFQPNMDFSNKEKTHAKMNISHYILMQIKKELKQFSATRLQKTAFMTNIYANTDYFKFTKNHYGPYSQSVKVLSDQIKEYQDFYKMKTDQVSNQIYNTIISGSLEKKNRVLLAAVERASSFINKFSNSFDLEVASTILYLIKEHQCASDEDISKSVLEWSSEKKVRFTDDAVNKALQFLVLENLINQDIFGKYCFIPPNL